MQLEILVKNQMVVLSLKEGKKIVGQTEFSEMNSLSKDLLVQIDKLLRKNKLKAKDLGNVSVKSEIDQSYTSCRIAQAVANAFNLFSQSV